MNTPTTNMLVKVPHTRREHSVSDKRRGEMNYLNLFATTTCKVEFIKCDGRTLFSERSIEDYLSKHTHKAVGYQDE